MKYSEVVSPFGHLARNYGDTVVAAALTPEASGRNDAIC